MHKTKQMLATMLMAACSLGAFADSRVVAQPKAEDAEKAYADLTVDTKVRFSATGMEVVNGENVAVFPFADYSKLSFETGISSGVKDLLANEGTLKLRRNPVESVLQLDGYAGNATTLSVFALNGAQALKIDAWSGQSVDVSSLPAGAYLISVNKQSIKFIKK